MAIEALIQPVRCCLVYPAFLLAAFLLESPALGQVQLLAPVAIDPHPSPPAAVADPNSLTLEMLEQTALKHNPTLAGAEALVLQQQGLLRQAGLYPNPTLGYVRSDPNQSGQSQTQGIFVSQDIVTAGKLRIAQDAFRQEVERTNWQRLAQQARIVNDVRIRFFETLGAQRAVRAAQDLEKLAMDGVDIARQLLKARQGTRPDVLQAEIQLSMVRISLRDAHLRHQAAWRQLAAVVGVRDLPPTPLAGNLEGEVPHLEWDALARQLLAESPLLRAQQAEIQAAEHELQLARAQAIPNLNVQFVAQHDSTLHFDSLSTLVSVPVPIFNRNQGNITNARGLLMQQRKEYERIQFALLDQLANSYRQFQSLRDQAQELRREVLPRARENLDLTLEGYKAGRFDFARVLTARQFYFQSNLAYVDALTELRKTTIEIVGLQLTGGLNPTEAGTALQSTPGAGTTGTRSILLQQLQDQRGGGSQVRPGVLQSGP